MLLVLSNAHLTRITVFSVNANNAHLNRIKLRIVGLVWTGLKSAVALKFYANLETLTLKGVHMCIHVLCFFVFFTNLLIYEEKQPRYFAFKQSKNISRVNI